MRERVLACFRTLHRTRKQLFAGDVEMLTAGRLKINEEFTKHKNATNPDEIFKLVKKGEEANEYLKTMVVQAALNENTGHYELKLQKDTAMYKNIPYNENWKPDKRARRKKGDRCSDT